MRALYDSKSKLDDRGIKYLLSEENKYKTWLKVEGALALSQAKEGFIPKEAAEEIASVPFETLDLEEMEKIKAKVGHGFVPFVKVLVKACKGEGKKYVHYGVTTQNIQQTGHRCVRQCISHSDIYGRYSTWNGVKHGEQQMLVRQDDCCVECFLRSGYGIAFHQFLQNDFALFGLTYCRRYTQKLYIGINVISLLFFELKQRGELFDVRF